MLAELVTEGDAATVDPQLLEEQELPAQAQAEEAEPDEMAEAMLQALQNFMRLPISAPTSVGQPVPTAVDTSGIPASLESAAVKNASLPVMMESTQVPPLSAMQETNDLPQLEATALPDATVPVKTAQRVPFETGEAADLGDSAEAFEPGQPVKIQNADVETNSESSGPTLQTDRPLTKEAIQEAASITPFETKENQLQVKLASPLWDQRLEEMTQQPDSAIVQPTVPTVPTTVTQTVVPVETKQVTLTWQEPTQVIQELGETITVVLAESPNQADRVVHIALTPENFGEMDIQLTFQEEGVEALIVVSKEEVKQQLAQQLELIRDYLPQNPLVQTIAIEARPSDLSFFPQQGSQPQKQSQQGFKQSARQEQEWEETEYPRGEEGSGLSIYI